MTKFTIKTLTPFGKLRLRTNDSLKPIIDDAWNAVIDTILQSPKFQQQITSALGKKNTSKTMKVLEDMRHNFVTFNTMWNTPMSKKYMCPHCTLQSNSKTVMGKHLKNKHPGKIAFYLVGAPF